MHAPEGATDIFKRFWKKVEVGGYSSIEWPAKAKPDCWVWVGASTQGGVSTKHKRNRYGNFRVGYKMWKAHRFAWVQIACRTLEGGDTIDHRCHYTLCVNPTHMRVRTRGANTADANRRRGRLGKHER